MKLKWDLKDDPLRLLTFFVKPCLNNSFVNQEQFETDYLLLNKSAIRHLTRLKVDQFVRLQLFELTFSKILFLLFIIGCLWLSKSFMCDETKYCCLSL